MSGGAHAAENRRIEEARRERMTSTSKPSNNLGSEPVQLQRTALHEAGHAVAGAVLRLGLQWVSIVPNEAEDQLGVCAFRSRGALEYDEPAPARTPGNAASEAAHRAWVRHTARRVQAIRCRAPGQIVATLAGPISERRLVPELPWDDATSAGDVEDAHGIASALAEQWHWEWTIIHPDTASPDVSMVRRAVLEAAMGETDHLIVVMWPAIVAVTAALLRARRMSGADVRRLVREHASAPTPISTAAVSATLRSAAWGTIHRAAA
jgi:hypothetical protein